MGRQGNLPNILLNKYICCKMITLSTKKHDDNYDNDNEIALFRHK